MTDITPRAALADAIDRHEESLIALSDARSTLQKAREFEQQLKDELAKFSDLDAKIAASRADVLKQALSAGSVPSFGQSPELRDAIATKVEIENQIAAAKQAISAIEQEVSAAETVEKEALADIEKAAAVVVDEIIDRLIEQLREIDEKNYELRKNLKALVWTTPINKNTPAVGRGKNYLTTATKVASLEFSGTPENLAFKVECDAWRAFCAALKTNPEAEFGGGA